MRILKIKQGLTSFSQSTNKIDWKDILTNKREEYDIPETPALQAILDLFSLPSDPDKILETITGQVSLRNVIDAIDSLVAMGWTSINAWKAIDRVSDKIRADASSKEIFTLLNSDKQLPNLDDGVQSIKPLLLKFKTSISRWRNVLGLLKTVNTPQHYQIIAQAKPAIDVLLSQEVQNYIEDIETSMLGAPQKGIPGAVQTLKWLEKTIPAKIKGGQSSKNKGIDSKPDVKTMNFNDKDEIASAMENLDDVKNRFSDYDPNNKEHFNRVYLLGVEAGKDLFSKEILRFRSKKYNSDNYQTGMESASSKVKGNKDNSKKVLDLYPYGKNLDDVVNFASWITFLLCVSESKTSSIDPGTLEKVCERYILRLNARFPAWTRIPDFSRLPYLMQSDASKQSNPVNNYEDAVDAGINLFSSVVIKNEQLYNFDNTNEAIGAQIARDKMATFRNQIEQLANQNGTSNNSLEIFVSSASFLFCLMGSGTTSNSLNAVKKLWQEHTAKMTQAIPNWYFIKEFSELNNLKSDVLNNPTNMDASEGDIRTTWQSGISQGLKEFERMKNDKNIKLGADAIAAENYAKSYLESIVDKVVTSILSAKSFNKKSLTTFSEQAFLIIALTKAKATGANNYNLKANQEVMFGKLDANWRGWQETQIFSELSQMSTSGGFGIGFSSKKAMEIWQNLMPKTIARIKGDVEKDPKLANSLHFKKLFSNGWLISRPNDLEKEFGQKLITPESVQVAKETIRHSSSLSSSNVDLTADYILNRIAGWCSGNFDYESMEPAAQQNMAKKYYQDSNQQPTATNPGTKQPYSEGSSFLANQNALAPRNQSQNSISPLAQTSNPGTFMILRPNNTQVVPYSNPGTAVIPRQEMNVRPVPGPGNSIIPRPSMGVDYAKQPPYKNDLYKLDPAVINKEKEKQEKQKDNKVRSGTYSGAQFLGTICMALTILLARATEQENLPLD
jgi:hypothetical protein